MRVYSLTDLGKKVTKQSADSGEEMRILNYIRENKTVTSNELEVVGGLEYTRSMIKRGLIKELTQ